MKRNKMLSLDEKNVSFLKEKENASAFVDRLVSKVREGENYKIGICQVCGREYVFSISKDCPFCLINKTKQILEEIKIKKTKDEVTKRVSKELKEQQSKGQEEVEIETAKAWKFYKDNPEKVKSILTELTDEEPDLDENILSVNPTALIMAYREYKRSL